MKRAARIMLLIILALLVIAVFFFHWQAAVFSSPDISRLTSEPASFSNDPVIYFIYRLFVR